MTEPLLSRKKVAQVKIEAVKGTAETTGFIDVLCFEPDIRPTGPFDQRKAGGLYLGHQVVGIIGEKSGTFSCSVELRGDGASAMDPGLAIMLQACGFLQTIEVYTVDSDPANHSTITIVVFTDGKREILSGAMGNVTFEGETGKAIRCNFEFQGIYGTPTDVAMPAFDPQGGLPPIMANGTFTLAAAEKLIGKFSLNMGNEIINRLDVNAASGILHACIVDIDPVVTFDLESEKVAGFDIYGAWLVGTEAALSLVLGPALDVFTFTMPKIQHREIPASDRDGLQVNETTAQCNHDSGDDAVTLAAT